MKKPIRYINSIALIINLLYCTERTQQPPLNPYFSLTDTSALRLSDKEWKSVLTDGVYTITREGSTEAPYTNRYWKFKEHGRYHCASCGRLLFCSAQKFDSETGWPSFWAAADSAALLYKRDYSQEMQRVELRCRRCLGHVGHLFYDGPAPTYQRYCINSLALFFVADTSGVSKPKPVFLPKK